MKTAFDAAIEASYYANKLWDVVTNPVAQQMRHSFNFTEVRVAPYPSGDRDAVPTRDVPQLISILFDEAAKVMLDRSDEVTHNCLAASIGTLERIVGLKEAEETSLGKLCAAIEIELPHIKAVAEGLKLDRP